MHLLGRRFGVSCLEWLARVSVGCGSSRQVLYQVLMYHPCRPAAGVVGLVSVVVPVPVPVAASERQCAASLRVSGCGRQMPHLPAAARKSSPNQRQREPSPSAPSHPVHTPYLQRQRARTALPASLSCLHGDLALATVPEHFTVSSTLEPRRLLLLLRRPMMTRPP